MIVGCGQIVDLYALVPIWLLETNKYTDTHVNGIVFFYYYSPVAITQGNLSF